MQECELSREEYKLYIQQSHHQERSRGSALGLDSEVTAPCTYAVILVNNCPHGYRIIFILEVIERM